MAFLTALDEFDYRPLNNGFVINESRLVWEDAVTRAIYTVPQGFESNLMSYPWWAGWLFNKLDNTSRASMLHDYLVSQEIGNSLWRDDQYVLALKSDGVNRFKRAIAYIGLRVVSGHSGRHYE
jgi:hypothetical protein